MEYTTEQPIRFDIVSESQLSLAYPPETPGLKKLKILSLFSGCGGMDLGFEGGFIAPYKSVAPHPEWIDKRISEDWVSHSRCSFWELFHHRLPCSGKSRLGGLRMYLDSRFSYYRIINFQQR